MNRKIYLDYAAATPMDKEVLRAMEPYFSDKFHNPSASYLAAKDARRALEQARAKVAGCLGARPAEIVFTAGATEANNLAIQGVMRGRPDGEVLVSAIEHESVLEPAKLFKHRLIPVTGEGLIDLAKLEKMITPKTVLVSIGLVNNELGTLQPLGKIAKILDKSGVLLHSDAAQAPSYIDLQVSRLGVDMLSINGGKIYGPKQSGALYMRVGVKLQPLIVGGGQEFGLRSGTENTAGVIGLAAALKKAQLSSKQEARRVSGLRELFILELTKKTAVVVNGSRRHSAPHILSVIFPGQDNERLMMELDEAGVQAATGSACSASSREPSHVLSAIGLSDEQARSTLRFSLGRQTTDADINKAIELLSKLTK